MQNYRKLSHCTYANIVIAVNYTLIFYPALFVCPLFVGFFMSAFSYAFSISAISIASIVFLTTAFTLSSDILKLIISMPFISNFLNRAYIFRQYVYLNFGIRSESSAVNLFILSPSQNH